MAAGLLLSLASTCGAQVVIDWTAGGADDRYNNAANWTGGDVPNETSESARFNLPGAFDVTLADETYKVSDLLISAGAVDFTSEDVGVQKIYVVADDAIVNNNAFFRIGEYQPGGTTPDFPVYLDVADELRIDGGGVVTLLGDTGAVSRIRTSDLRLADVASGLGTLTVVGPGAVFEQDGIGIVNIGQNGSGYFTVAEGASADFTAVLQLANAAVAGASASVRVEAAGTATLNSLQIATSGTNSATGDFLVTGTGSTADVASNVTVGAASGTVGTLRALDRGRITIQGTTTVDATGTIEGDDFASSISANGQVTLADGGTLTLTNGATFTAMAGFDSSAGGVLDIRGGDLYVIGSEFKPVDAAATSFTFEGDTGGAADLILDQQATTTLPHTTFGRNHTAVVRVWNGSTLTSETLRLGSQSDGSASLTFLATIQASRPPTFTLAQRAQETWWYGRGATRVPTISTWGKAQGTVKSPSAIQVAGSRCGRTVATTATCTSVVSAAVVSWWCRTRRPRRSACSTSTAPTTF